MTILRLCIGIACIEQAIRNFESGHTVLSALFLVLGLGSILVAAYWKK